MTVTPIYNLQRHCFLTLFSSCSLRADRQSLHPAFASSYARHSPIPLEAPVIQTTFSFNAPEKISIFH